MDNRISLNNISEQFVSSKTERKVNSEFEISMFPLKNLKNNNPEIKSPAEEYSLDNLAKIYPKENFDIKIDDGKYIVFQKGEATKVFSVEFNEDKSVNVSKYNNEGDRIEEITKNQYGIMIQKRTIDPYGLGTKQILEYDDSGILQKSTDIYISYKDDVGMKAAKITTYKDGTPYKIETTDPEEPIKFPLADSIKSKLDNNDPTVINEILKITPEMVADIGYNFYSVNIKEDWLYTKKVPLLDSVEESKLSESQKKKAISHLKKTIETAAKQNEISLSKKDFDYNKAITFLAYKQEGVDLNFTVEEAQISNPYYTGDKYSLNQDGMEIKITNKSSGDEKEINLEKLLSQYVTINEKAKIIELIQKIPPEVLMDMAYEIENFKPPLDALDIYTENALGYYYPMTNEIAVNVMTDPATFIHEMGHAVDHIGKDAGGGSLNIEYSTDNNTEFSKVFETEMEKYLAAGYKKYDYDDPERDRGVYATANPQEMFAECYDLLMRGDSGSKETILKYFPKTLEFIKNQIAFNRSQSDRARQH